MGNKIGVALSGGGAFGAYRVGVLKAYVEDVGRVDVLAGSSVGALNMLVLASAPSLEEGVKRLGRIWVEEPPALLRLTLALASYARLGDSLAAFVLKQVAGDKALGLERGVMSQNELRTLLDEYVDADEMADGVPVYVSVYKSEGGLKDVIRLALAEAGLKETPKSQFIGLQSLSTVEEQIEAVLASAAVPVFFRSRSVGTGRFADGVIGGRRRRQGATPVDPLVDEKCDLAFVSLLGDGSPWSRDDYPMLAVVEIRPRTTIGRGFPKDLFELDRRVLASWMGRGYDDAKFQLGRVLDAHRREVG